MSCQSRLLAANLHWCTGQFACCECIISCRHESNNVVARNDITTPTVQRKMGQSCPGIKNWSHRSVCSDLILFQKMYCFYAFEHVAIAYTSLKILRPHIKDVITATSHKQGWFLPVYVFNNCLYYVWWAFPLSWWNSVAIERQKNRYVRSICSL